MAGFCIVVEPSGFATLNYAVKIHDRGSSRSFQHLQNYDIEPGFGNTN
jgi:hypothetical protein